MQVYCSAVYGYQVQIGPLLTEQYQSSTLVYLSYVKRRLVGIFVGATSGIGKISLLKIAQYTRQPRLHFIGRSQRAADEILLQLKQANPDGHYEFVKADASLLSVVDEVCESIRARETKVDVLSQSQGTLDISTETSEKLPLIMVLHYYSRMRFITNLLPLLQHSPLSRVVLVLAGTKEGPINPNHIPGKKVLPWRARCHLCSMTTLTPEHVAKLASRVSFVHSYPGFVATPLAKSMKGATGAVMKSVFWVTGLFSTKEYVSLGETGERHCFLATSSRFGSKARGEMDVASGQVDAAVGCDGMVGSGVYIVDGVCESGGQDVQRVVKGLRQDGIHEKIWEHLQSDFSSVTGEGSV